MTASTTLRFIAVLALSAPLLARAQPRPGEAPARFPYPPQMEGSIAETYKKVGKFELKAYVFAPRSDQTTDAKPRPAIVFFFGGGWKAGSPVQFERQSRYLAARGMVAIAADYRVATRQHAKPSQSVADAKSCIRWLRRNAGRLGIAPDRIVAAGGSAGGHLALATLLLPGLEEAAEETTVSSVPNAAILFNPCVMTAPMKGIDFRGFASDLTAEQLGAATREALSPLHHVRDGIAPMLILHGRSDVEVPCDLVEAFARRMRQEGNRCDLNIYDDQPHGFFNDAKFTESLQAADDFLVSLRYLPPRGAH